jgi:hypothetical protein
MTWPPRGPGCSGWWPLPHLIILPDRDGAHVVLMAGLRLRLLPFPFPGGGWTSVAGLTGPWSARCWLSGELPGIRIPRLGSPPTCRTARPPSSRVSIDARTAIRIAWSSHRALIPLGSTSDFGCTSCRSSPGSRPPAPHRTDLCRPHA